VLFTLGWKSVERNMDGKVLKETVHSSMVQCGLPNVLDWQIHVNITEILEATWTPLFFVRSCFSLLFLQTLFGTTLLYSLLCSIMYASVLVLFHILRLFLQIMSFNC